MIKTVPYLAEAAIEKDAESLLSEFSDARDVVIEAPIPIEEIIEKYLKIGIEFDDLDSRFGVEKFFDTGDPDILGAMYFDKKRIAISEHLVPEENPNMEGRYRFTLAHEGGGHWRLHRHLLERDAGQWSLFGREAAPSVICRSNQRKARVEWQADYYASCLLMPQNLVLAAWAEAFPDRKPRVLAPEKSVDHSLVEIPRISWHLGDIQGVESDQTALDSVARPFAEQFLVSPIAMRIRLEKLGLLMRTIPRQHILTSV
jgi:Zn-dependent peptidase ImmA (M78 family)